MQSCFEGLSRFIRYLMLHQWFQQEQILCPHPNCLAASGETILFSQLWGKWTGEELLLASSGQKPRSLLNILKCTEHLLLQIHHIHSRKELTSSKCQQCGGRESCTPLVSQSSLAAALASIFMFYFVQLCLLPAAHSMTPIWNGPSSFCFATFILLWTWRNPFKLITTM